MKIYSMTATFGKLDHETLTLKPGLNIIEAPNEWGKSTWCAFLVAMLYGIDTRERTKGDFLADKEHYAPWSGAPMSGRIDLNWNGRDITVERATRGRSLLGHFRAYETATGLEVPELTGANCGQLLLGVEKSVFTRSGFLRLADLPVTQDESLRRRLNALVTTGDESGASDALAGKLRDLKNQCRSNRTNGLIPKAETQREALEGKLRKLAQLREQTARIQSRQESLAGYIADLENHQAALDYAAAMEYRQKAAGAALHLEHLQQQAEQLDRSCAQYPTEETLMQQLRRLQTLRQQLDALQLEARMHPDAPAAPQIPLPFCNIPPEQAERQAQEDADAYDTWTRARKKPPVWPVIAGGVLLAAGIALALLELLIPGLLAAVLGIVGLAAGFVLRSRQKRSELLAQSSAQHLLDRYAPLPPAQWVQAARDARQAQQDYQLRSQAHLQELSALRSRMDAVQDQLNTLAQGRGFLEAEQEWKEQLDQHRQLADLLRQQRQTESLLKTFTSDRPAPNPPAKPDAMTFSAAETARLLSDAKYEQHQLQLQLGNAQGQMESLGLEEPLRKELEAVNQRLCRLEQTYRALELAQQTLQAASESLQRRFAPRIAKRAQALFAKLTGNRYDRLILGQDLSLSAGAQGEDILHGSLWRSDGTVDQLYLALRLAVAEELTPQAPLILDDALVRFDDLRLACAMQILTEAAQHKQVILFTCQKRESAALEQKGESL